MVGNSVAAQVLEETGMLKIDFSGFASGLLWGPRAFPSTIATDLTAQAYLPMEGQTLPVSWLLSACPICSNRRLPSPHRWPPRLPQPPSGGVLTLKHLAVPAYDATEVMSARMWGSAQRPQLNFIPRMSMVWQHGRVPSHSWFPCSDICTIYTNILLNSRGAVHTAFFQGCLTRWHTIFHALILVHNFLVHNFLGHNFLGDNLLDVISLYITFLFTIFCYMIIKLRIKKDRITLG